VPTQLDARLLVELRDALEVHGGSLMLGGPRGAGTDC